MLGKPPSRELIIGSAGGNEILASLYFGAPKVEAVELNPVTVGLLENQFADYTGHLADRPDVKLTQGDGRTYLARSNTAYDLVWYVAPDSYAATNAASSGAFVLSESYLYTRQMIAETLRHLSDDGIMVVQFGELDLRNAPNRTGRYIVTARAALEDIGISDPSNHLLVSGYLTGNVRRPLDHRREAHAVHSRRGAAVHDGRDADPARDAVARAGHAAARLPREPARRRQRRRGEQLVASYPKDISAISDDASFLLALLEVQRRPAQLFAPDRRARSRGLDRRAGTDPAFGLAVVFAAVFLLLPFVVVRRQWRALPAKGISAVYFAALGLGFMLFEITMIQRLTRFLGYPTYSLTVTLAALLVSDGHRRARESTAHAARTCRDARSPRRRSRCSRCSTSSGSTR